MLESTKKDTLYPKTKKKSQWDGRRGTIKINSNHIHAWVGGQPTNWKIIITQKFSHRNKSSEPHARVPSLGVLQQEEEPPENLALKAGRVWLQEFYRTGWNRNSTLEGCIQGLMHTRTQGKKQWPHKRLGKTYLLVLENLLQRWGEWLWLTARTKILAVAALVSTHWWETSWRLPFTPQDLAWPNSL